MTLLRPNYWTLLLALPLSASLSLTARAQPAAPTPAAPAPAPANPPADALEPTAAEPSAAPPFVPPPAPAPAIVVAPAAAPPAAPPSEHVTGGPYDGPPLLLGPGKPKVGAYGSLGIAYTHMLHRDGVVADLAAAVLIDHRISLGLAGYLFSRTPKGPPALDRVPREFSTGYGGVLLRYATFASDFPVYGSLGVLIGGGVLSLHDHYDDFDNNYDGETDGHYNDGHFESEGYFVCQPDISLHVNATRWLRFGLTGGYRFATAVEHYGYDATAMSGAVVGGNIELGWF